MDTKRLLHANISTYKTDRPGSLRSRQPGATQNWALPPRDLVGECQKIYDMSKLDALRFLIMSVHIANG